MKKIFKILIVVLIILFLLWLLINFLVALKAKPLIIEKLKKITQRNVSLGELKLKFPFNLEIKKLEIEGSVKIDYAYLSINFWSFLLGKPTFNDIKIKGLELCLVKKSPPENKGKPSSSQKIVFAPKRPAVNFIFKNINIEEATINFFDYDITPEGLKITMKDAHLNLENLFFIPISTITNFNLEGKIPWSEDKKEAEVKLNGWVNLYKKDLQANLEINNIDGIYLYPYYRQWVDLEKSRINKATLNFKSDMRALNNDLIANCTLELSEITFKPKPENEPEEKAYQIAKGVLGLLKAIDKDKISLNFTIHTKMDKFEFGLEDIRLAFEDKISQGIKTKKINSTDLLNLPTDFLKNVIKGSTEITKVFIESTVEIGKTITDIFTGPFKKNNDKNK
jgi:hypothetical protein